MPERPPRGAIEVGRVVVLVAAVEAPEVVAVVVPEVVAVDPRAAAVVVAPSRAATNAASNESTARHRSSGLSSRSIAVRWRSDAPSLAFLPAAAAE